MRPQHQRQPEGDLSGGARSPAARRRGTTEVERVRPVTIASASPVATMQAANTLRSWLTMRWQSRRSRPFRCNRSYRKSVYFAFALDSRALWISMPSTRPSPREARVARTRSSRPIRIGGHSPRCDRRRRRGRPFLPRPRRTPRGRVAAHPFHDRIQRARGRVQPAGQIARVTLQVDDRPPRHAGLHRGARHGGGTRLIRRGSNAFGMMYSAPKVSRRPEEAECTSSGTSSRASCASASAAAIFMASLMVLARTSSAPRKMYGKPRTLLT